MRLIQVLSAVGPLYELRQMLEPSGVNRGYCFAVYQSLEGAKRACIEVIITLFVLLLIITSTLQYEFPFRLSTTH